jgi:hypothetical protein
VAWIEAVVDSPSEQYLSRGTDNLIFWGRGDRRKIVGTKPVDFEPIPKINDIKTKGTHMKQCFGRLLTTLLLVAMASFVGYAQGGGSTATSISGVVLDASGAVIPGAEVTIKNDATSAEFKTVTGENGTFTIPALNPGTYTANISVPNFKTQIVKEIKISPSTPGNIRVVMQVGGTAETVVVQANTEVVQSSNANISTTLNTSQLINLPSVTRSAMDLLTIMPGVNTTGTNRASTIVGLPQSTINITIDGINTQDNYNKTTDGFFTMIQPRLDSIQEVSMSTATPGAEAAGQGAVQIRFVTRSGNNDYHGSLYEYHKNPALNANYWFTNRNLTAPAGTDWSTWKAPRAGALLNQFGGRWGGPISLPKKLFGPLGFSGKDRAFFFVNYEESRQPGKTNVTNTLYVPEVLDTGNFIYTDKSGVNQRVNLINLAQANNLLSAWDPTMLKLLKNMQASTLVSGSVFPQTDPLFQYHYFQLKAMSVRKFLTTRGDFNLTSKHRLELSWNYAQYPFSEDFLNTANHSFPGSPYYSTQGGNRFTTSSALRSTLTPRLVNEARFGLSGGTTVWYPEQTDNSQFKDMEYFYFSFPGNNSNYSQSRYYTQRRSTPPTSFDDTLSWTKGSHSLSFGGNFTNIGSWFYNKYNSPSVTIGLDQTYDPAKIMFDSNNVSKNFPNYSSSSQITQARALYATITGRVTAIGGTYYLDEKNIKYAYQGADNERFHQREMAAYVSDSWRLKPGLTLTYGARWELQLPVVALSSIWSYTNVADIWGLSGANNMFKPSASGGQKTQVYQYKNGDTSLYNTDWKSVAPSLGVAWSPNVSGGILEKILGSTGKSVFRGGYSIAYNRFGMGTLVGILSGNIGLTQSGGRSTGNLNFPLNGCTDGCPSQWPVLFSQKSRLIPADYTGSANFPSWPAPIWPMTPLQSDNIRAIDPNIRTPYTQSWSIGYQRELTRDTALEVRYVANRNYQNWDTRNMNGERNIYQDSFKNEFKQAVANLAANLAYNNKATFAYTGAPGTGPLPLAVAFWQGKDATAANDPKNYTSSLFTNTTLVNALAPTNTNPGTYASNLDSATYRQNAINAGVAANYFRVNPAVNQANLIVNGGYNYYDSLVVEVRRRLSKGLLVQANYVFAKSLGGDRISFLRDYVKVVGGTLPHTFKVNWLYEMPWGKGKPLLGSVHGVVDRIISNWELQGIARIQSGNMLDLGGYRLIGMTMQDVRDTAGLIFYDDKKLIYNQPEDIRLQTINAFSTSGSYANGYSATVPTGRYIAPASSKDCIQYISGDCAPYQQYFRGPKFIRFDLSLVKRIRFTESKNFELRGEFLNAFNNINFSGNYCAGSTQTCGLVDTAWRDTSNTGEQGGRAVQIQLRINF